MAKFRGYVAGPMLDRAQETSIDIPLAATSTPVASDAPAKSKHTWPWQKSAWAVAVALVGTFAVLAARLDSGSEAQDPADTTSAAPPAQSEPIASALPASPVPEPPVEVEEKKKARNMP
jgi:hypothetical protein